MKKITILAGILFLTFFWGMAELRYGNQTKGWINLDSVPRQKNEEMQTADYKDREIRVLLKNDEFASEYHSDICFTCDGEYEICGKEEQSRYQAGEWLRITPQSSLFAKEDRILVDSEEGVFYFPELVRAEEGVGYEGSLEIRKTDLGLLVVNVLPLEAYLCGVLPSEMSASFPMEALKAQAVCARTYALQQKEEGRAEEYGADLDDSTSYQVYNNRCHSKETDKAVKETAELVMKQGDCLADARYYSTSCGLDLQMDLSEDSVFAAFLQEDQIRSVEAEEPFFRWKESISLIDLPEKTEWKTVDKLHVAERNAKGAVTCLEITGQKKSAELEKVTERIDGEYQIRQFLAQTDQILTLQDGSTRKGWQLLPSAFFYLQPVTEEGILTGYEICGGGYGHGEGMSQNGARNMAEQGENYEEILKNYYGEIRIVRYSS